MGTRSLTKVYGNHGVIFTMYRHMDGYPSGHGAELAEFLVPFSITNGISLSTDNSKTANGMECLSAQIVAHFKNGPGGIYIHSASTIDIGEEYIYKVGMERSVLGMSIYKAGWDEKPSKLIYTGTPIACLEWCNKQQ